jgi:hypothetical protein
VAAAAGEVKASAAAAAPAELPEPEWLRRELPGPARRTSLPEPMQQEKSVSLWAIIKECVGKDLSRVCLPVYFNEPLSALQRIAEEMEYSQLLDQVGCCLIWPLRPLHCRVEPPACRTRGIPASPEPGSAASRWHVWHPRCHLLTRPCR